MEGSNSFKTLDLINIVGERYEMNQGHLQMKGTMFSFFSNKVLGTKLIRCRLDKLFLGGMS